MRSRGVMAVLAMFAAMLCAAAGLTACGPMTSAGSIYRDVDRDPDPAIARPYLEPGAPGADILAEAYRSSRSGQAEAVSPIEPVYHSADIAAAPPGFRVWIDGHEAVISLGSRTGEVGWAVGTEPTVRFELKPRLGEFRSAIIQVYRLLDERVVADSGIMLKESGEATALAPGRDIFLAHPGPSVTIRHIASGRTLPRLMLAEDARYEIQLVVGGNLEADVLSIRVHTAAPPSGHGTPAGPGTPPGAGAGGEPQQPQLPPGVTIP